MITIHSFSSTSEAYDETMSNERISTGDILLVPSERVVGIAYTWPFAVTNDCGNLHIIRQNADGDAIIAQFSTSYAQAIELATSLGYMQ